MSSRCPSAPRLAPLATLLLAALSTSPALRAADGPSRVDPRLGPLAAAAVTDAARRLGSFPCALILGEFVDSRTGAPLSETLAATGRTAAEGVLSLRFESSAGLARYAGRRVFAFTVPGTPVVYLCREPFSRIATHRRLAAAVVIHEFLHSLGLGDDRPSSASITERVLARCG